MPKKLETLLLQVLLTVLGLLQGFYASLLCDVLANGLGFWSYERGQEVFRNKHNGRSPNPTQKAGIGALTAVFVMTSTMPIEVVMRRLQVRQELLPIPFAPHPFLCNHFPRLHPSPFPQPPLATCRRPTLVP